MVARCDFKKQTNEERHCVDPTAKVFFSVVWHHDI